jgi:ribosome-associated protein
MIQISRALSIPEEELRFSVSRSSGPGGQHVNKVSTRVALLFDVTNSPSLSPGQKRRILAALRTRTNKQGVLRVVSQQTPSLAANRNAAVERFIHLLQQALKTPKQRKKTTISASAKQRRLGEKKERSRRKRERGWKDFTDEY